MFGYSSFNLFITSTQHVGVRASLYQDFDCLEICTHASHEQRGITLQLGVDINSGLLQNQVRKVRSSFLSGLM